jgi:hypothetical protein
MVIDGTPPFRVEPDVVEVFPVEHLSWGSAYRSVRRARAGRALVRAPKMREGRPNETESSEGVGWGGEWPTTGDRRRSLVDFRRASALVERDEASTEVE